MPVRMSVGSFASLTAVDQEHVLRRLVEEARNPSYETRAILEGRIRTLEVRYEMSSDDLRNRLRSGEVRETAEIAYWLFLLETRESGVSA